MESTEAVTTVTGNLIDVSGVDFTLVLSEMVALLPAILPVAVSCIAFRKGISFILSMVRGA